MKIEVVKILISNRSINIGELISGNIGLDLKNKYKTFPSLVEALDEVLYILNNFKKVGYITIKEISNGSGEGKSFFNGIPLEIKDEKAEITANKLHWFVEHIEKIYRYEITTESGLIEYIKNNYRTNDEINWERTRNLSICIALITSVVTSVLTSWLSYCPIVTN